MGEHWTDERIELLKKLWSEGFSAKQIADQIGGISRNAIMGKVHRLNLEGRQKIVLAGGERKPAKERPAATRKAPPNPKAMAAVQEIINRPPPAVIEQVAKPKSLEMSLLDLKDGDCRWPTGERADITFCGHNTERDKPYCTYHCRLAYNPRVTEQRTFADRLKRAA